MDDTLSNSVQNDKIALLATVETLKELSTIFQEAGDHETAVILLGLAKTKENVSSI